jgi:hypothetical protein
MKLWPVETSADGKSWREVAQEEDNEQLNGSWFTGTFAVADGGECCFVPPANIGMNHGEEDEICICAWEIFGGLSE